MSNGLLDFRNRNKDHPGVKYSEMATTNEVNKYRNGSIDEQSQIDYERNDSVCPLTTPVSHRGRSAAKMGDYSSEDHLDFKVSKYTALRYRRIALILAGIALMLAISTIVLAAVVGNKSATSTTDTQNEVCTRPECIKAAARILGAMNRSADPCDDFFTYSCGQWNRDHVIPEDKSILSTFYDLRDGVALTLKRVLETDSSSDRDSIKKAKTYYASCMDTATIDSLEGKYALEVIEDMGGMPLFGDALPSPFSLEDTLARAITKYGTSALLSMGVGADSKNSSQHIVEVDQPALGMPSRDYYIQETRRNATLPAYRTYMHDYLAMLWQERSSGNINDTALLKLVDKIVEIETELAEAMMSRADRRDRLSIYNKRTIEEMKTDIVSDFDWERYLNSAFSLVNVTLEPSRDIVSYGDFYFKNFTKIVSQYDHEFLQNFIVWAVLRGRIFFMSKSYRETRDPYRKATSGTSQEEARWKKCADETNGQFLMPVGSLFVQDAFPGKNKLVTETMVENIRTAFIDFLPGNDWMDDVTKTAAKKKADMVAPVIAYPDYIVDTEDPEMDEDFETVKVTPDEYFRNNLNCILEGFKYGLKLLDEPVERDEWTTGPAIVNAFYNPLRNQISFPAGILQPPFYDPGQPNAMNYGGIGMVIGHEITHGFDDSGAQYDGNGNLKNWWSEKSNENFKEKAKCIEDQYGNYYWEEAESNLNGKLTLGENIADNGGLRQAYTAYETWKSQNEADFKLPGLEDFSHDQLFFLSNAQVWCGLYRPEFAARLAATDGHSPGIYRVIGTVRNFDKFGEAYNCQRGKDKMYPQEKDMCKVWG